MIDGAICEKKKSMSSFDKGGQKYAMDGNFSALLKQLILDQNVKSCP